MSRQAMTGAQRTARMRARKRLDAQVTEVFGVSTPDPYDQAWAAAHPGQPSDAEVLAQWKIEHPFWFGWTDALARMWAATDDPAPTTQVEADLLRRKYIGTL